VSERVDGQHAGLDYHLQLLADPWRVSAWKRAIEAMIRQGDTVLDAGTGLGTMAVWAARAGAGRVIAVESADVVELAREIVARAGVDDVVEVVAADLATVPPEPVDVVLADFVGRLLPDAAMRRAVTAAGGFATERTRFLPARVQWHAAALADVPVPALDRWSHPLLGVDLSPALARALHVPWTLHVPTDALAGPPAPLATLTPPDLPEEVQVEASLPVRAGVCRGVLVWFAADLAPGVTLDTGPGRRTFWGQVLWAAPRTLVPDGELRVTATVRSGVEIAMDWHIAWPDGSEPARTPEARPDQLLAAGLPGLALPELVADGIPGARAPLAELITALVQVGDPLAATLLATYERRFGPHPRHRRG